MRVVSLRAGPECGGKFVKLRIEDTSASDLPEQIEVEFGPCRPFLGEVGEFVRLAVSGQATGAYRLACAEWERAVPAVRGK
jgi:hypothetical protein